MRLVVGLGNPGARYARMRHNIGFRVLEAFAMRHQITNWRSKFYSQTAQAVEYDALLARPQTFMNASGEAVAALMRFFDVALDQLLVVCDDITLPFAHLRMRRRGSSGGHNGLRSIIEGLSSQDFARLRVGVGRDSADATSVVLGVFNKEEERALAQVIDRAVNGVEVFLNSGIDAAICAVNASGGAPPIEEVR